MEGRLAYRQYTDSDWQTRGAVEIVAADVQFLSGRRDGGTASWAAPVEEPDGSDAELDLDDIPF